MDVLDSAPGVGGASTGVLGISGALATLSRLLNP